MSVIVLDFLKCNIQNENIIQRLLLDSRLSLIEYKGWVVNSRKKRRNEEYLQYSYIKEWNGIYFCFKSNFLDICLKPHYFFNGGIHNSDDFDVGSCIQVLNSVIQEFSIPADELQVMSIEYGLNFISPIPFQDLISSIEYHSRNKFYSSNDGLKFSKVSGKPNPKGILSRYKRVKFYAKGIHQPLYADENLIRFEIHSNRKKFIESLGIYTLKDLLEYSIYEIFADSLMEEFKQILFLDYYNPLKNLTLSEKKKINEFNNSHYWYKVSQAHRNTFNNNKKSYLKLLDKTGENIHQKVGMLINEKIKKLLKPCAILTPTQNTNLVQF